MRKQLELIYWRFKDFLENWIWPGYYLKNCLFHRYDIIEIPNVKLWEYIEDDTRIYFGVFEPIKHFVEGNPEKYVCWYKDEKGNDVGHRYGECDQTSLMFPELKGTYVMDLIKEIYNFYTKEVVQLEDDEKYILNVWGKYIHNCHWETCTDNPELERYVIDPSVYSINDQVIQDLDWNKLNKYGITKENFFEENFVNNIHSNLKVEIAKKKQYYLHLAIEVREYLWT